MAGLNLAALKEKIPIAALEEKVTALPPQKRALLLIATLVLLGGGFYALKYKDLMASSQKLHNNVQEGEKRLADLKLKEKQIDGVREEVARAREELSYYLAFLPDQREIPGLLESVSRIGSEVGLENILFQPQAEQQSDFYAAVPVRLDLVGTYNQLGVFLDRISKLDRILKVENLSLARQPANSTVRVSCTLYTYRFSEQAQKPADAGKGKGGKK